MLSLQLQSLIGLLYYICVFAVVVVAHINSQANIAPSERRKKKSNMASHRSSSELSLESIGYGGSIHSPNVDIANLPKPIEFSISKLEPEGGSPSGEYVYNNLAFLIYCPKHNKIALSFNERSKAVWLPFISAPQNKTWNDATTDGISIIFSKEDSELDARLTTVIPIKSMSCLHVLRIQLPITQKFICRLTQLITLDNDTDSFKCCQSSKRLKWVTLKEAINGNITGLWGPEVPLFASFIVEMKQQEIYEYGLDQAYFYIPSGNNSKNVEEEMLLSLQIGMREVEKVYSDFLEHGFPCFYMTFSSFHSYLCEYFKEPENNEETILSLFQAFNFNKNGYLNFYEFLLGLVSLEPNCINNEARLKFVFRYYDADQDGVLNEEENGHLATELGLSTAELRTQVANKFGDGNINFTRNIFHELVTSGILHNTETLCRAPTSIIGKICQNFATRNENRLSASKRVHSNDQQSPKSKGLCLACRDKKYEFGSHYVRLDPNGRCVEPRHLSEFDREGETEKTEEISMYKYSQDYVFSTVSIGHTFLDMIRDFNNTKGTLQKPNGFLANAEYREIFISYLNILCQNVRSILECEEKLIKINSPAFVIGDIRGNLEELVLLEKVLWQSVPVVPNNFVFLGNYVNVGKWGIECVLYILALKIIAPNKYFLLRGNNECRSMQKNAFYLECLTKYGNKHGQLVWNAVNEVFDRMAIALIIDESVMCVNSGVPSPSTPVEDIFQIGNDLKDPLEHSLAKQLLGNGKCSEESCVEYLHKNNLSHLIRANQYLQEGYQIDSTGMVINVFSTSHYCGKSNESAVICVEHPKIRIVKLDTSKCQPSN